MRVRLGCAIAVLGMAGCQQSPEHQPANQLSAQEPATSVPDGANQAAVGANALDAQAGALPPPTALRFVGLWAADVKNCSTEPWRFTDTSLSTPAGSHCTFSKVTQVPGGYDIAASCTAEGPPKGDTIKIRFAQSAQAMLFDSDVIADTGLVYCGREG